MFDHPQSTTQGFDSLECHEAEQLRSDLAADESEISRIRARQIEKIRRIDELQLDTADGARTLTDWVVANLDVSPQTAGRVARIAQHHQPDIEARMASGEYGLDRANFLCQIRELNGPEDVIADSASYSLGHLFGLIERLRRIDGPTEQIDFEQRYMVLQPSLDQCSGRFCGQTQGTDWQAIEKALLGREGELPSLPEQTQGQRRVDALASICMDSLTGTNHGDDKGRAVAVAEIFVDAALAAPSFGEAGVTLSSGPRVGPATLSEILCTGQVRVIYQGEDGRPIGVSDRAEAIPPAVRAFVLKRDHGSCQIDGCRSRYRIQPHHVRRRADGGDHDPDNLVSLCWYHHHVAIHMIGMRLDPQSPKHRRRLLLSPIHGPPATVGL